MIYLDPNTGLIPYMRDKLKGSIFGEVGNNSIAPRVWLAADVQIDLDKGNVTGIPYLVVCPGPTDKQRTSETGSNNLTLKKIEHLDVYAVLDSKKGKTGKLPADQVHAVRIILDKVLFGFNPSIYASNANGDYGPQTHHLEPLGDDFLSFDSERYIHEFNYELVTEINVEADGIGASFPEAIDDLNAIFIKVEPVDSDKDALDTDLAAPSIQVP